MNMKTIILTLAIAASTSAALFAQKIKGSDTCLPLSQKEAEVFMKSNPGASVTVCGCREIHREYDSIGRNLVFFSSVYYRDDDISAEPMWCYCLNCGVRFDPVQEAFAV